MALKSISGAHAFVVCALSASLLLGACADDIPELDSGASLPPSSSNDAGSAGQGNEAGALDSSSDPVTTPTKDAGGTASALDSGAAPGNADAASAGDTGLPLTPSDGAVPTGEGGTLPPWATREDLGKGDGTDVITIGDSWMTATSGGIERALDRAGTKYRHYGRGGTTFLSGQIPSQYDTAKRANPKISTVLMTGGGNDIMFTAGSCSTKEACAEFTAKLVAGFNEFWTKLAADGVKDVIYIAYSDNAGATPIENRGQMMTAPICLTGMINCHSLSTTALVAKADLPDSIHPSAAAHDRIAKALLTLMEERKMRR